jgi:hypothetical protein
MISFKKSKNIKENWKTYFLEYKSSNRFFNNKTIGANTEDPFELSLWCAQQNIKYYSGQLTTKEFELLNKERFNFKKNSQYWLENAYLYMALKRQIKTLKGRNDFPELLNWYNSLKKDVNNINFYDGSKNDEIEILIKGRLIDKQTVKKKRFLYEWLEKADYINNLLDKERIYKSSHKDEYKWIETYKYHPERLSDNQKKIFNKIVTKFEYYIELEKQEFIEKENVKKETLKKDPNATVFTYKPCPKCGNIVYSLKNECTQCVKERDKKSKEKRKKENPELFSAKVSFYSSNRRTAKINAQPKWLTFQEKEKMKMFYEESSKLTVETGDEHHVDHIIPLVGKDYVIDKNGKERYIQVVCGLHCPENLKVLKGIDNKMKSARFNMDLHDENEYLKTLKKKDINLLRK